jgi:hypothetical protein
MSLHKISYNSQLNTTEFLMQMNLRLFPPRMGGERVIYHSPIPRADFTKERGLPPCLLSQHVTMVRYIICFLKHRRPFFERTSRSGWPDTADCPALISPKVAKTTIQYYIINTSAYNFR